MLKVSKYVAKDLETSNRSDSKYKVSSFLLGSFVGREAWGVRNAKDGNSNLLSIEICYIFFVFFFLTLLWYPENGKERLMAK